MQTQFKKSHFAILGSLALLAQAIVITTLHLKSNLIDHLVQKNAPWSLLLQLVAFFAVLQVLGALVNVLSENLNRFFSVDEFRRHWNLAMPRSISRSQIHHNHKMFNGLYNNIPKLFSLQVSITLQILTASVYAGFFVVRMVHDKFWLGLLFIPVIGLFSWGAGHLYSKSYQEGSKNVADDSVALSSWLELWFRSSRERSLNWGHTQQHPEQPNWYQEQGGRVADRLRRHAMTVFKRDVFGSLLVDWPYILCVTLVLISVVQGKLTIGEFLIWTTLIDYLMSAFSSLRFIKKCRMDKAALQQQLNEDLGWLPSSQEQALLPAPASKTESKTKTKTETETESVSSPNAHFRLLSGESVQLSLKPGFYHVAGSNGSGKTTLMDTLLGFNDRFERWDPEAVAHFQSQLLGHSRIIERDCVLFPEWNSSVYAQIFGHANDAEAKAKLISRIYQELSPQLAQFWATKLEHLESLWALRPGSLSSGEKVVLALMRMFAVLDADVRLIAVDECDSVLDHTTAAHFQKAMHELSRKFAVWYVSHTYQTSSETDHEKEKADAAKVRDLAQTVAQKGLRSRAGAQATQARGLAPRSNHSLLSTVYLLGYERETARGFVTPCQLAALSGGQGAIEGTGNVGKALADVLSVVKRAFIHMDEHYRILNQFDWQIDSVYREAEVGEIKSAGLALAAGMLNVIRQLKGLPELRGLAATGHILLDGSVVPVAHIEAKLQATQGLAFISQTLSFQDFTHLKQLEATLLAQDQALSLPR